MVVVFASFALFQLVGAIILARLQGVIAAETQAEAAEKEMKEKDEARRKRLKLEKKKARVKSPSRLHKCLNCLCPPWVYMKPAVMNRYL